jgi:hypothetical protein
LPKPKQHPTLLEFAKRGAQAQLADLRHEIDMLIALFPHLKNHDVDRDDLPVSYLLKQGAAKTPGRKRKLSAAGRRAISEAQKARWAAQRKTSK